ncbi:hypothetical protein FPQ18DRAFT_165423 [Pyronema domesticum]|nr:hypothetical protein FPQ18DRAFT_165423 [Pyronema domesticum]
MSVPQVPRPGGAEATQRTFRICLIDESVTKSQLHEWLRTLKFPLHPSVDSRDTVDDNVLALSLVPSYDGSQTAAVTFSHTPRMFIPCKPRRHIDIAVEIGGIRNDEIVIDCDFYGMTPLYICAEPGPTVDIIGVPGLSSHAFGTWKDSNGHKMWLRDFLCKERGLKDCARILIYGYDSILKDSTSTMTIRDHSRKLLDLVRSVRSEPEERY